MELGEKLANLRRARGMSQQEVAAALGVARQTVSNWESGASAPTLDKACDLARLYRVGIQDLVDDGVGVAAPPVDRVVSAVERDLHVLRSLVGKVCWVVDGCGMYWPDPSRGLDVTVLGVTPDWLRVSYSRSGTRCGLGGEGIVELLDLGRVSGFMLRPGAPAFAGEGAEPA